MLTIQFYPSEKKFYTDNIHAPVTNSMFAVRSGSTETGTGTCEYVEASLKQDYSSIVMISLSVRSGSTESGALMWGLNILLLSPL